MLDASTDPRMDAVRELFDELGGAVSVEVTEYGAERRVSPGGQSFFCGRRMMPKTQLMSEMMIAATQAPPEVLDAQAPAPEAREPRRQPQQEAR